MRYKVLDCVRLTPSAQNRYSWYFVIVENNTFKTSNWIFLKYNLEN